jgi:hypothetical protein
MIAQGMDGLSRGIFLEGVVKGEDMLSFVDLSRTAIKRHPEVLDFVKSWVSPHKINTMTSFDTEARKNSSLPPPPIVSDQRFTS